MESCGPCKRQLRLNDGGPTEGRGKGRTSPYGIAILWQFQRICDYRPPVSAAGDGGQWNLIRLWRWLAGNRRNHADEPEPLPSLAHLEQNVLDRIVPDDPWPHIAAALSEAWETFFAAQAEGEKLRLLVAPPGWEVESILTALASDLKATLVKAPPGQAIFDSDRSALDPLREGLDHSTETPLVVPGLHRYFLRHHRGLDLVRTIVDRLRHAARPTVVGCDSWAWAYLTGSLQIDAALPQPYVPVPLDGLELASLLRPECPCDVALSGRDVLLYAHAEGKDENSEDASSEQKHASFEPDKTISYWEQLAVRSRGIPEVARAIWRYGLRTQDPEVEKNNPSGSPQPWNGDLLFAVPVNHLELPTIPSPTDPAWRFMLHTLLVHDGVPVTVLPALLPFSRDATLLALQSLEMQGLVRRSGPLATVAPLAYPQVRDFLLREDLLVDAL
jgi:hypothetical protein